MRRTFQARMSSNVIRPQHLKLQPRRPRETLADVEGPIDKSLGTKEALAVHVRKLAIWPVLLLIWPDKTQGCCSSSALFSAYIRVPM
jgi:hypothetical protein